ncbi:hypothetical protein SGRA_1351 [Saprospira grandis str. Lewin]|uniref:Uncharacterized protein n=1 Tax=Saprospira grandis (strain Lewin) TaxID=984262 RepID=H6L6E4_SAPGL|nr:hypothetical protein SGRA_1351 [Saprospira grandis str. Lewin]
MPWPQFLKRNCGLFYAPKQEFGTYLQFTNASGLALAFIFICKTALNDARS